MENYMMEKLQFKLVSKILLILFLGVFQNNNAQCVDNSVRPSDTFSFESWSPRCHNGNDGEIRVFNIASTAGNDLINQAYAVRILTGPNGSMQFPIPTGATSYTITGLQAGNYVIDIIDSCGGNSADKSVVISNPIPNITSTIVLKDKISIENNQNQEIILRFKISMVASGTGGDVTYVFTNNLGQTLSFTRITPRVMTANYFSYSLDAEIPETFFNGTSVSYTCANLCGIVGQGVVQKPSVHNMIWGQPNMMDAQDPNNSCNIGYDIKIFRNYMVNPITITVEETINPGNIPLNFFGQPITSQTLNLVHLNAAPIGMATVVNLGLKYNVHYTLHFTDAHGLTATETIIKEATGFNPSLVCDVNVAVVEPSGYFDDASLFKFNALPLSSQSTGPLLVTVNSGPTSYSTSSGSGNAVTSSSITYPYSFLISTPYETINVQKDNVRSFPPGNYNFTITDGCNKTYTFSQQMNCIRNNSVSHQLNTCANVSNLVNTKITVPRAMLGSRATIYKADGTVLFTGPISTAAPFNFTLFTGGAFGNLSVDLPNNESYIFRYGGMRANGTLSEPTQFGGTGALPRLTDGYLYEYSFSVTVAPFQFTSIVACDSDVEMSVSGGTAPYNFTLLDSTGNTQLFPNQSAANFTGLLSGMTYIAKVIDSCGREFSQEFTVQEKPTPIIQNIIHPACNISFGSVTFSNLPNNWTLTDATNNLEFNGNNNEFTIENLNSGIYSFICIDNETQCAVVNQLNLEIEIAVPCPIVTSDNIKFNSGEVIQINVLENDTQGAEIDPTSVRIVANSNFISTNYDSNNEIIVATVLNEGTWTVDIINGVIVFQPSTNLINTPSPIQYYGKDLLGNISNHATITLDLLPIAVDDQLVFSNDTTITYNVLQNDTLGDIVNPETLSFVLPDNVTGITYNMNASLCIDELIVANEGTWSVCPNSGIITFQPDTNFNGVPTDKLYTVKDYQNNVSNIAKISFNPTCEFNVVCPTITTIELQCFSQLPNTVGFSIANFEALGGSISANSCGTLLISASSSTFNGCNSEVYLTITITEFQDNNSNGILDNNESTNSNTIECTITYIINDTITPTFNENLPENTITSCNNISAPEQLTATDNCSTAEVEYVESIENGSCENNYIITRTWIATDNCGNATTHTQTITVQDTEAPQLITNVASTIEISTNDTIPSVPQLVFVDNCSTVTVDFTEEIMEGDCENSYEIHRTWTATDSCGNENYFLQIISVMDTTPPSFTSPFPTNLTVSCDNIPEIPVLYAYDGGNEVEIIFEEERIEGSCNSRHELRRTWTATDACGNSVSHTQVINLVCHINIYNALSLNDDGKNEIFLLDGIECFPNNSVEIYNRWGAKVFETAAYDNKQSVFKGVSSGKGTVSRNEKLPTGTYFYVINYQYNLDNSNQFENVQKTGYLYIVNN
jgi:gliding motility-associated-like protein